MYRFDIADDETTVNITPDEHPQFPSMLVPSPPRKEDPPQQEEQYYAVPSPVHEEPQQGQTKHMIYSLPYGNKDGLKIRISFFPPKDNNFHVNCALTC